VAPEINTIIILNNEHCFNEDPEYGCMLKKMWEGDLDPEDRKRINTRVIGFNGLELPSMLQGEYQIIPVQNNFSHLAHTCINMSVILTTRGHLLCMPNK
jgi:hypothetical protein